MWWLNQAVGLVVKILLLPFRAMNPWAGMIFISLLTAILMLFIYKKLPIRAVLKRPKI